MSASTASECLKLGLHLEYLRSVNSASAVTRNDVTKFAYLLENQASLRYAASKVAAVVKALLTQLEKMNLRKALDAAAEYRPMLAEVEAYLAQNNDPATVILNDHFADSIVRIAERVLAEVREEIKASA